MSNFVFAGTPAFAERILRDLLQAGRRPRVVYTQPDRASGRGRKVTPPPVKRLAEREGIEVRQPGTLNDPRVLADLEALEPELLVVAAYGLLLPERALRAPGKDGRGAVNVHPSLLPRWRGAAPVERAIMAGDACTGVCLMQMVARLDAGPVFARASLAIAPTDTAAVLEARLAELGAELLIAHFDALLAGTLQPEPQPETGVTYAERLRPSDFQADFTGSAAQLARAVRALVDRKALTARLDGEPVKLCAAEAIESPDPAARPGTIVALDRRRVTVACGEGALGVTRVRLARGSGRVQAVADVLNGYPDLFRVGKRFQVDGAHR